MELGAALALVGATMVLVAIPGPNVALIVANTLAYGFRFGATTVVGTTIGVGLQLSIVVLGLTALLEFAASTFTWLKWAGVFYLLYLGVQSLRQGTEEIPEISASKKPLQKLFWRGLLLATINPKTLVFNAAFLPQFVGANASGSTLLIAASIYLAVIFLGDLLWAATANTARPLILRIGRLRHQLTGFLFVGCGIGLALSRAER